ncbi:HAD family hydrolase [Sediminivirga luteola]|uniref:Haloacid dehalogenase n=1 Tax=Sediminivirga luteola TaxID=1774748 RepID=A0A8J2XFB8_9MICO|nr:HAD family hydrolase [Sediminivirga luteola]MCI2266285.1 Cof-type HAD-IIB family hydrolase [Sediminivirga luteola]GGA12352.1 haloacid dehalogenase [Sediminivirga luteola]
MTSTQENTGRTGTGVPPVSAPHIIALDVDGTIVDYDDRLSEPVREAVQAADAAGHHVTIATGRAVNGALDTANRLGLTRGFVVASNGSVIVRLDQESDTGWRLHHVESFDPAPALERMREVVPTALWLVEDTELERWTSGAFPEGELMGEEEPHMVSFKELLTKRATRIVMRAPELTADEFRHAVSEIGMHGVTYAVGWSNWLDIAPEGISKASGLEIVRQELGVPIEHTVCAGDGLNDMEMMGWAKRAVAMGQSLDVLKAEATEVTGTVEEDGLAEALRPYAAPLG